MGHDIFQNYFFLLFSRWYFWVPSGSTNFNYTKNVYKVKIKYLFHKTKQDIFFSLLDNITSFTLGGLSGLNICC